MRVRTPYAGRPMHLLVVSRLEVKTSLTTDLTPTREEDLRHTLEQDHAERRLFVHPLP